MGSGSLAAMSVFEAKYNEGLTVSAIAVEVTKNVYFLYISLFWVRSVDAIVSVDY